jgi:hypothetical protein
LGFSGGGGSTGVSAHVHSSAVGEGGSLDLDTEMNNAALFAQGVGWW